MLKKLLTHLHNSPRIKTVIALFLIVLIALHFRLAGFNYDKYCCQHPDERAIIMFTLPLAFPQSVEQFLSPDSPLNPNFFAYGNFPLYVLKGVSSLVSYLDPEFATYGKMYLVGRAISIVADLGTLLLIFLLGKNLFSRRAGAFAAFVYAISVLPIQYSHFFAVDSLLTFFIALTLFRIVKFYQKPNIINALFVGIAFGLSLTTKISAIPLIISISFAIASDFIFIFIKTPHKIKHWLPHLPRFLKRLITEGVVVAISTVVTFILLQPYALIDFSEFISQNMLQSQMTHNAYIFPYTLQYVEKLPYLYELKNVFLWGLGPFIFIFSALGFLKIILSLKEISETKRAELITLLTFCVLYFALVGKFAVGWMRYMLPLYPLFALFSGYFIWHLFFENRERSRIFKFVLKIFIFILLIIWPLSFISIYSRPNTRLEASDWMRSNIPLGKTLAVEHWDDRLPMHDSSGFNFQELALYEQPDNQVKWDTINNQLSLSDYIIIASNRLYTPLQKLSDCSKYVKCYPHTARYYQDLFSNRLNFELIKEFSSYPTIPFLGFQIIDNSADESFTVYDHPKIYIFKKKE